MILCNYSSKICQVACWNLCVYIAFEIQVLSMSKTNWYWGDFRTFQFVWTIHLQKNCWRLSRNLCVLCQQCLWHTSTFCQELWFGFLVTVEVICSIGEHIIQCRKNSVLNIERCVKTKVNNINWEWWKEAGREWSKKDKRLTDQQVSTKDFT